jgi:hypothetical protein
MLSQQTALVGGKLGRFTADQHQRNGDDQGCS